MQHSIVAKGRKVPDANAPTYSLTATDVALIIGAISVLIAVCALLMVRVLEPQDTPGPGQKMVLGYAVVASFILAALAFQRSSKNK